MYSSKEIAPNPTLSPFSTLVFRRHFYLFLLGCSLVPSAKGQTEDENFQRLDQQNKFLQRRMNVKVISMSKCFGVENGWSGKRPLQ